MRSESVRSCHGSGDKSPKYNASCLILHIGFVVDKVTLGHPFLRIFRFSPVRVIPPMIHNLPASSANKAVKFSKSAALLDKIFTEI
jgi:hypothetical protein